MPIKKFYGVRVGRNIGIFDTWKECQKSINGFSGAEFKSFLTLEETEKYIKNDNNIKDNNIKDNNIKYIKVYTDGACSNNGKPNAKAGIGVFFAEGDPRNYSGNFDGKQTNNIAEIKAIIKAYEILENEILENKHVLIFSDSKYAINAASSYGKKQDKNGWSINIPNKKLVREIYELFKDKNVEFRHVLAHTNGTDLNSIGNRTADILATSAI